MGIRGLTLTRMKREQAQDFITSVLASFEWYIFFFPFERRNDSNDALFTKAAEIMDVGGDKVCVVDFTRPSPEIFAKLWNKWEEQAPKSKNSEVMRTYQAAQAAEITDYNIFEEQPKLKKRAKELRKKLIAVQDAENKATENDEENKLREEIIAVKDAENKAAEIDKENKLSEELL